MSHDQPEPFFLSRMTTPIGEALLVTDAAERLCALDWSDYEDRMIHLLRQQHGHAALQERTAPARVTQVLSGYFAGKPGRLDAIACRFGGTPFQREVWSALRAIPAGATTSYGALAARIGRPGAVRAVGHANGSNPISVVVPCHRVVGADGSLTGYGGGLARKRWLLAHEGVALNAAGSVRLPADR